MAFVSKLSPTHYDIPHESGQWIEMRPIRAGQWRDGLDDIGMLAACISTWSYDETVTPEIVADLDNKTFDWARSRLLEMSMRSDAEKKDSNDNSSDGPAPEAEASPTSSPTS